MVFFGTWSLSVTIPTKLSFSSWSPDPTLRTGDISKPSMIPLNKPREKKQADTQTAGFHQVTVNIQNHSQKLSR